jgi:periplasmic protein TonB
MADSSPTPTAQVAAREIPVTIQGSQIIEGTERRELFTETLKTTLIFENGAAINLKARVARGQSLFLRNELSGREILCRVVEAPPPGQPGCTDLEFTIHDPDFWNAPAVERAAADARDKSESQESSLAAAENTAATPSAESSPESGAPTGAELPAIAQETPTALLSSSSPEQAQTPSPPGTGAEVDDAKEAEQLAGILAKYARAIAKRASAKSAETEAQQQAASDDTLAQGDAIAGTTGKGRAFSTLAFRLHGIRELTVRKNPIALGIVACIVIGSALGVTWDVTRMLYPAGFRPLSAVANARIPTFNAKAKPSKPESASASKTKEPRARPPKIQPPAVAQVGAARIEKSPAATTESIEARSVEARPSALISDRLVPEQERQRKQEPTSPEITPAKIVAQFQPPLPKWAKDLDLGGVVTLDAVIDEKGNLRQAKLLSGPRVLESSAEGAVGLWIFQPALKDGKPTTAHLTLTVEFQR